MAGLAASAWGKYLRDHARRYSECAKFGQVPDCGGRDRELVRFKVEYGL